MTEVKKVEVVEGGIKLSGRLCLADKAKGVVVFAYGGGSSMFSPREMFVSKKLCKAGFDTLLFALLTDEEEKIDEQTREYRFNIDLLSERLDKAAEWLKKDSRAKNLPAGLFGASTGAAAALEAAAKEPRLFKAAVSRGGRPDLASNLDKVKCPVLLIVGGEDREVIEMNKTAMKKMKCENKLEIVPGATHLFEEPGALEKVAKLAADWFKQKLK